MENQLSTSPNPSFFSQATNFTSAVSGHVDPRTGLFGFNINLGHIIANNQMGPELPLELNYSPIAGSNMGLGNGVSFPLTSYDSASGKLVLFTGEQYIVTETASSVRVLQQALKSFIFTKTDDAYIVTHKDGLIEVLAGPNYGGSIKVPLQIYTPTGHSINLEWQWLGSMIYLKNITDNTGSTLLSLSYPNDSAVVITVLPQLAEESYNVTLGLNNNNLQTVTSDAAAQRDGHPLKWEIEYTFMGAQWQYWVTAITRPTGGRQVVTYRNDSYATRFPDSAPTALRNNPLPCVQIYQLQVNGAPSITTHYSYGGNYDGHNYGSNNFLGYGSGVSWSQSQDNTFNAPSNYCYLTTETYISENGNTTINRLYNNYHLMITQEKMRNECSTKKVTEYYINKNGKNFSDQPPYYQFPKTSTTIWKKGSETNAPSRSEITSTTFDDFGNPLTKTITSIKGDVSTLVSDTLWTYYPAQGESSDLNQGTGCPPPPCDALKDIVRFIKTVTVKPPVLDGYTCSDQISVFSYTGLETPEKTQAVMSHAILKNCQRQYSGSILLSESRYSYADKNDTVNGFARLIQTIDKHYPDGQTGDIFLTTTAIAWKLETGNNTLTQSSTLTTYDNKSLTHQKTLSRFSGLVVKETDALGVSRTALYDKLSRVIQVCTAKSTAYENTRTFSYQIDGSKNADAPLIITATDIHGNQLKTGINSSNQPIWGEVLLKGSTVWQRLTTATYDDLGRKKAITDQDFISQTGPSSTKSAGTMQQTLMYDDWGVNHQVLLEIGDGILHWKLVDPVEMTVTEYSTGTDQQYNQVYSFKTVTTYNVNRQPVQIDLYPSGSNTVSSTVRKRYDGLNRLREQTDELGRITTYEYDNFGRTTLTTLPKINEQSITGVQITRRYSPQSPSKLLSEIMVTDESGIGKPVSMGTQIFDSLGRVTSRASGGRTWKASYNTSTGSITSPETVIAPDNAQLKFSYIAELNGKIATQTSAGANVTNQFSYNNSGKLLSASQQNTSCRVSNMYDATGRLAEEVFHPQSYNNTVRQFTTAGQLSSYTDVTQTTQLVTRDTYGRVAAIDDPSVIVSFIYDPLGRLQQWITQDKKSKTTLTTALSWDTLGRESSRTVTHSSGNVWQQTISWYKNHQISGKTLSRNNKIVKMETYSYDARNRLVNYNAGQNTDLTELPQDEMGNRIRQEAFSLDAYSNILKADLTFSDGSKDRVTYIYSNPADPCQLTNVTHTHSSYSERPDTKILYDTSGAMIDDGQGRIFTYHDGLPFGYLKSVTLQDGSNSPRSTTYSYDALDRLISQDSSQFCYRDTTLVNQINGKNDGVRLITGSPGNFAQIFSGTSSGVLLSGTDANGSVLSTNSNNNEQTIISYGPYGEQNNLTS
jgi:YD repeat-containing protein